MILGRQVPTPHTGPVDLLAIDGEGSIHVLELKKEKTPRDVSAQTLDYGSWVATLGRAELIEIFERNNRGVSLDEAFEQRFDRDAPEEINSAQQFTIVAASVDAATERIVRFLNETYGVPINVVFFRHYADNGGSYLARTWLVSEEPEAAATRANRPAAGRANKLREQWNGRDWAVSFGHESSGRDWSDARRYGFVCAGGGDWYSRTLRNLPEGARVFTYIPGGRGYVGVGQVTATAVPFDEAQVKVRDQLVALSSVDHAGNYERPVIPGKDMREWVVRVDWVETVPLEQAFNKPGLRMNQNSAWQLRSQFTIDEVSKHFGIDGSEDLTD